MAELLTNNPDAMKSLSGKSPTSKWGLFGGPCGLFWFSGCSYNNFNDWFGTLKSRYNILRRNYQKLKDLSELPDINDMTPEEIMMESNINYIKEIINEMNAVPQNLSRKEYFQKITTIQSALADTNSLLEQVQDSIENRDQKWFKTDAALSRYVTTGIQRPWGVADYLFYGGIAAVAAYGTYKVIKNVTS